MATTGIASGSVAARTARRRTRHRETYVARVATPRGDVDALRAEHFAQQFPPHFHDTFAIGVLESGHARIDTRYGSFLASPGLILAFAPGEVHAAAPLGASGYSYRMLYPPAAYLDGASARLPDVRFRAPVIDDEGIRRAFLRVHEPVMEHECGEATAGALSDVLRRLVSGHGAPGEMGRRPADRAIADRARAILREHLAGRVTLAVVAAECGVTVFHLIRAFRRVTGVTPYAYLIQLRVNRAQLLLRAGAAVTDAAYSCGFSDQSHLTRIFRRVVGVPPGQYLRQARAGG
jgi:AraC-like DNA-binding protein